MEKSRSDAKVFALDKDLSWAYQEIVYEAFFVIWMASAISIEFARRFFPEWSGNRVDPDFTMPQSLLEELLQHDGDLCFWNRVVSHWKQMDSSPCQNRTSPFPTPDPLRTKIGCVGALAALSAMTTLFVSFLCLLFANRRWRLPEIREPIPYLNKIYAWKRGETVNDAEDQDNERGSDNADDEEDQDNEAENEDPDDQDILDEETKSNGVQEQKPTVQIVEDQAQDANGQEAVLNVRHKKTSSGQNTCTGLSRFCLSMSYRCRKIWKRMPTDLMAGILGALLGLLLVLATYFGIVIWNIIMVCPVVLSAVLIMRTTTALYGEEIIFPCYTVSICILAIYCSGRIWGLWMNETYYNAAGNAFRKLRGLKVIKDLNKPHEVLEGMFHCTGILDVLKWICMCETMWVTLRPFFCRQYPDFHFTFLWLSLLPRCFSRTEQDWDLFDSMSSYWVDASHCIGNMSTHATMNLPDVPPAAKTLGAVWAAWSVALAAANSWPLYLFFLVAVNAIVCMSVVGGLIHAWNWYRNSWPKRVCFPETALYDNPTVVLNGFRYFITMYRPMYTSVILPGITVHFFLPEKYQLPGRLFMVTCFTIWNYYAAAPAFWKMRRATKYIYGAYSELWFYCANTGRATSGLYDATKAGPQQKALPCLITESEYAVNI